MSTCTAINVPQKNQTETKQNKKIQIATHRRQRFKAGGGGVCGFRCRLLRLLSQGHTNRTGRKTRPRPFPHPLTSRPGHRVLAPPPRTPPFSRINKNVLSSPLSSLFFLLVEEKRSFPVFPRIDVESTSVHTQSSPQKQKKKGKKRKRESSAPRGSRWPSALSFMLRRCTLYGPPVFAPGILAQSVLQSAS